MKIYLLGHKGFLGTGFSEYFRQESIDFIGIDRTNYDSIKGTSCDLFINANGNSKKRLADAEPFKDLEMNTISTLNTLQDFKIGKYVYISTIDVYVDTKNPENNVETALIDIAKLSNYGASKYLSEQLVRHYAKDWLIFRLGGMVGTGLKKNSVYDISTMGKSFVSPQSRYQYISNKDCARLVDSLAAESHEIYNICGNGTIAVKDIFGIAKKPIPRGSEDLRHEHYEVNIDKIKSKIVIPDTYSSVKRFLEERFVEGNVIDENIIIEKSINGAR